MEAPETCADGGGSGCHLGEAGIMEAFREQWDSLWAAKGFGRDSNPWVWRYEVKRKENKDDEKENELKPESNNKEIKLVEEVRIRFDGHASTDTQEWFNPFMELIIPKGTKAKPIQRGDKSITVEINLGEFRFRINLSENFLTRWKDN